MNCFLELELIYDTNFIDSERRTTQNITSSSLMTVSFLLYIIIQWAVYQKVKS